MAHRYNELRWEEGEVGGEGGGRWRRRGKKWGQGRVVQLKGPRAGERGNGGKSSGGDDEGSDDDGGVLGGDGCCGGGDGDCGGKVFFNCVASRGGTKYRGKVM